MMDRNKTGSAVRRRYWLKIGVMSRPNRFVKSDASSSVRMFLYLNVS